MSLDAPANHPALYTATPAQIRPAKRILVVRYSQSGQLGSVVDRILVPLYADPQIQVHVETLKPRRNFPFPWSLRKFLDAFPESALQKPGALEPLGLTGDEDFDLVILPYQVWFLAPSQPVVAFLRDPVARRLLTGNQLSRSLPAAICGCWRRKR